ncbi:hypothetical protein HD806DRAFT_529374 [Xylariaceae sp. AK1471]|nr:hypothetical protein HD806DRAFT_529374 [Xylariaceae sp. AK1471]
MSCGNPIQQSARVAARLPLTDKLDDEALEIYDSGAADTLIIVGPFGATRAIRIFEVKANNNGQHVDYRHLKVLCI